MQVRGQTVIVTGAARGIGRGIAEGFAREGARVVLADLGSRTGGGEADWAYKLSSEEELEAAVEGIRKAGDEAASVEVDVTDAESCKRLIARSAEIFGPRVRPRKQRRTGQGRRPGVL